MFYKGDLQSAINEAVKDSKLVACFVTDNEEESQLWENEYLQDPRIKKMLSVQSVLLRLEAKSTEAGYLAAIFPIPTMPTLVVIKDGQLKEYLTSGIVREDFQKRLISVLYPDEPSLQEPPPTTLASEESGQASTESLIPTQALNTSVAPTTAKAEETSRNHIDDLAPDLKPQPSSKPSALLDQKNVFKQKKQQERDERARILKRVEDDKINRRNEAARRKEERQRTNNTSAGEPTQTGLDKRMPSSQSHDTTFLLFRLFDGSTIRTKFPSAATLSNEVRNYLSENQPAISNQPYVFKHVLSPLPNRKIEAAEETQSLRDLGCVPSATLILAPISDYTEAYSLGMGAKASSLVGGVINNGLGLVRGGFGLVTGALGAVIGGSVADNRGNDYHQLKNDDHAVSQMSASTNVRTQMSRLEERNCMDEPQFYNGNSVNFQPRPKNHDEEQAKKK
ncbi:putative ubx domain-containing protein [Erysiphe necator]|uniref:UBX domain-containing protein 2 n=1 Tax=Uncinula necator TaxID=52586 RepID=A0A0B1PA21_UNCNE|nr:putative ubx domain-containing protein [Erysiphe necator]